MTLDSLFKRLAVYIFFRKSEKKATKMRIALINYDKNKESSFYVKDSQAFSMRDNTPYAALGGITNKIFRNMWNIPFVYDGYFLKYSEGLPDLKLDIIIAIAEYGMHNIYQKTLIKRIKRRIRNRKYSEANFIDELRKKYQNALIIGYFSESHPYLYYDQRIINFLNLCDRAAIPLQQEHTAIIQPHVNKQIYSLFYPYKIAEIRKNFLDKSQKERSIFITASKSIDRIKSKSVQRGYQDSQEFGRYLAAKYNYKLISRENKISWVEWLRQVNQAGVCLNLDPTPRIGQAVIDSAILETPHLGSNLDAAKYLFPATAINDLDILEQNFRKIIDNPQQLTAPALQKLQERYSYDAFKAKLDIIIAG